VSPATLIGFGLALPPLAGAVGAAAGQAPAPPSTASTPAPPESRQIRAQLLDRVSRSEIPSVAIGVVRGDPVIWEETVGWADREAGIPARPDTRYAVASVSKSITGTAAVVLAGQGKLRLEDSVEPFVATGWGSQPSSAPILVSHLLAHRSGVPHIWHFEYADRPQTVVAQSRLVRENAFAAAAPDTRFLYSNLGYGVLARVIERAGGASFQGVMERTLFAPLAMRRTTVDAWVGDSGTVRGYSSDGEPIPYRFRLSPDGGAGFFSTLHDLLQYARFHLTGNPTLPRQAAIVEALVTMPARDRYLRGWGVVPLQRMTALISDGEMAGGTAAIILVPERKLAAVVLCNATGCPIAETAVAVLSSLIPGFAERFAAGVQAIEQQLYAPGDLPAGRFEGSAFTRDGAEPMTADFSDPAAPVLQVGGSTFRLKHLRWERGTLEATARGERSRFGFQLWLEGEHCLRGLVREEVREDRPGFARLWRVELERPRSAQTGRRGGTGYNSAGPRCH
jgi:CubicO group peptidase (beta-lactamase class C family)